MLSYLQDYFSSIDPDLPCIVVSNWNHKIICTLQTNKTHKHLLLIWKHILREPRIKNTALKLICSILLIYCVSEDKSGYFFKHKHSEKKTSVLIFSRLINAYVSQPLCFKGIQSNPDTASLCTPQPSRFTHESLGTEIPYLISKGIPW
jgi:hypothetical protein